MVEVNRKSKLKASYPLKGSSSSKAKTRGKARRTRKPKDPTQGLEVANPNAAAIDIGSSEHWVAVPAGRGKESVSRFGCCTEDLNALARWLKSCKVDTVVLEATGHYWMVLYDLLEARKLHPLVVNPRYAKNMSGKKGDIPDCQWMQKLHTYGLFTNSFRPVEEIRALRSYMRQRETLVAATTQSIQHMQKALTEMNVQLTNVISDISGETGLRIIDAILAGERDPERLARLKHGGIKASLKVLARALRGHWKEEQLFVLGQARCSYAHYQEQIQQCSQRIEQLMGSMDSRHPQLEDQAASLGTKPQAFDLGQELQRILGVDLTKIPGIGPVTAQVVLSEIGTEVGAWPTENHFASWLGVCPDHRITGGKIFGRSTRPVVNRVRNALRMAAYTLDHSHSALGAKYRRLKRKLGAPKAIIALANHLAKLIYRMIKFGHDYIEQGMAAYEEKYRAQHRHWLEKKARELGLKLVEA
jgi:transposase